MFKVLMPLIILSCCVISCGKKIENKDTQKDRTTTPVIEAPTTDRVLKELKSQKLSCGEFDQGICPEFIAKVSILSKTSSRACQGTLIGADKVLLSGSCLPKALRTSGASCKNSVVVSFSTSGDEELDNYECDIVESITSNLRRATELWDNDLALIRLRSKTSREPVSLSSLGIEDSKKLTRWSFKVESKKVATITKDSCIRVKNSYASPFANSLNASFQIFSGCKNKVNILGAAMLDSKGEFVGVQSRGLSKRTIRSLAESDLLSEKTSPLLYVSNLGCSDYRMDNDYPRPIDCFQLKSIYMLDRKRSDLIIGKDIHQENIKAIEEQISISKKYFKWKFKFIENRARAAYVLKMVRPDCFFGVDDWIREFRKGKKIRTPGYRTILKEDFLLRAKLNRHLQSTSVVESLGIKKYDVKFNPFTAYVNRTTYLSAKSNPDNRTYDLVFEDIKECN